MVVVEEKEEKEELHFLNGVATRQMAKVVFELTLTFGPEPL